MTISYADICVKPDLLRGSRRTAEQLGNRVGISAIRDDDKFPVFGSADMGFFM